MPSAYLTGISGFIGAHVADKLLKEGWHVRACVRDLGKVSELEKKLRESHPKAQLDLVTVQDLTQSKVHDLKGLPLSAMDYYGLIVSSEACEFVFHVASPLPFGEIRDMYGDLIDPAINATRSILESCATSSHVKRFVLTSSVAAVMGDQSAGDLYTEADWNTEAPGRVEGLAKEGKTNGYQAYFASKVLAERLAWDFVDQHRPAWDLVVLNPVFVGGPAVIAPRTVDSVPSTLNLFTPYLNGSKTKVSEGSKGSYVDVRDVALGHYLAAVTTEASKKRFILSYQPYSESHIVDVIKSSFPSVKVPSEGHVPNEQLALRVDRTASEKVLGLKYRENAESFREMLAQLVPLYKA